MCEMEDTPYIGYIGIITIWQINRKSAYCGYALIYAFHGKPRIGRVYIM